MRDLRFKQLGIVLTFFWKLYRAFIYTRSFIFLNFYRLFPLRKQAFLSMYHGKSVDEHVLGAAFQISEKFPNFKVILVSNETNYLIDARFELVEIHSLKYLKGLAQSKLIVNNLEFPPYFRKRKGQVYVQFWHGTPIKKLGRDREGKLLDHRYSKRLVHDATYWDLLLSSSQYHTRILRSFSNYCGPVVSNFLLFTSFEHSISDLIQLVSFPSAKNLQIDTKKFNVLFAPSWRENADSHFTEFDIPAITRTLSELPDSIQIYWRQHQNYSDTLELPEKLVDTSGETLLYQFLPLMDLVVTDYSSIYFDCIRLGIPVLLLGLDLDKYLETPGIYEFDQNRIQFGYLENLQDLATCILNLSSALKVNGNGSKKELTEALQHFGFEKDKISWFSILVQLGI